MANPQDYVRADRSYIYGQGGQLNAAEQGRAAQDEQQRAAYEQQLQQSYAPLLAGNGGYTPQESQQILGQGRLDALQLTPQQQADNYLNNGEKEAITGNPWAASMYFNPNNMSKSVQQTALNQRGAVGRMQAGLDTSVGDYSRASGHDLSGTEGNVRGAVNNFASAYGMSPEEQQRMVTAAGQTARGAQQAQTDRALQTARSAGMDPLGQAAMANRAAREEASSGADAMTNARVAASDAAAQRQAGIEQARVGTEEQLGAQRLSSDQDLANREMQAAQTGGEAGIGVEGNIAGQTQQQNQYNASTGIGMAQNAENEASQRAAELAANRQGTNQYNQGQTYNRGTYADTADATRGSQIANQRLQAEQEARGYLGGMYSANNANANNEYGRQGQTYMTTAGSANDATRNAVGANAQPSWWERLLSGAASAAGAFAGAGGFADGGQASKPTLAIIGESGPEDVISSAYQPAGAGMIPPQPGNQQQPSTSTMVNRPTYALVGDGGSDTVVPQDQRYTSKVQPTGMYGGYSQQPKQPGYRPSMMDRYNVNRPRYAAA